MSKILNNSEICDELAKTLPDIQDSWNKYLIDEYSSWEERLAYLDTSEFSNYLINHLRKNDTKYFQDFFNKIEVLYGICDHSMKEFLTIGILESIQNHTSHTEIDYTTAYTKWLWVKTHDEWNALINFWWG